MDRLPPVEMRRSYFNLQMQGYWRREPCAPVALFPHADEVHRPGRLDGPGAMSMPRSSRAALRQGSTASLQQQRY